MLGFFLQHKVQAFLNDTNLHDCVPHMEQPMQCLCKLKNKAVIKKYIVPPPFLITALN